MGILIPIAIIITAAILIMTIDTIFLNKLKEEHYSMLSFKRSPGKDDYEEVRKLENGDNK